MGIDSLLYRLGINKATCPICRVKMKYEDGMTGSQRYDSFNGAANIGVRLLMLYADRICNEESFGKLFKTLRQMPTRNIFSDEDIARFSNKGKR